MKFCLSAMPKDKDISRVGKSHRSVTSCLKGGKLEVVSHVICPSQVARANRFTCSELDVMVKHFCQAQYRAPLEINLFTSLFT